MEKKDNERRKIIAVEKLETAQAGFANGISLQLKNILDKGEHRSLNEREKQKIIKNASKHFNKFLTALGVDWENDPNSRETGMRVSKAYVNDIWYGRYNISSDISSFPSNYKGIILEKNIRVIGKCSHHLETVEGNCHVAYIPGENGRVIGLSKLNRTAQLFASRGIIQEDLTLAIHKAVDTICENNIGTLVIIEATHGCVRCRGVKDINSSMITSVGSGVFMEHDKTAKQEVFDMLKLSSI